MILPSHFSYASVSNLFYLIERCGHTPKNYTEKMAAIQRGEVGQRPGEAKKKEIYKYLAPWTVYGMNWSVRPDKRFRLAIGSFIEDYKNKVCAQS